MNIDEFIEHTKEKAREHRYHADFFESDNPMNTTCIKSAEDCEQLAGWIEKVKEYQQLEERLNKVYGDCDGLLLRVVEMLEKHPCIDVANNTLKSRLLTDEAVDKWEEYKWLEEHGRLVKLPCKVGDTVWQIMVVGVQGKNIKYGIFKAIVTKISVDYQMNFLLSTITEDEKRYRNEVTSTAIGDTMFFTKSEAEAKVNELRGEEDEGSN